MRSPVLFLAALGFVLPACSSLGDSASSNSNALSGQDPEVTEYLNSKEFGALTPRVQTAVKDAITLAPGATSRGAMLSLFKSVKWTMLGAAASRANCLTGEDGQLNIAAWIKATATVPEAAAWADPRAAVDITTVRTILAQSDVRQVAATLNAISARLTTASPPFPAAASCGGSGSTTVVSNPDPDCTTLCSPSTPPSTPPNNGCVDSTTVQCPKPPCVDTTTQLCPSNSTTRAQLIMPGTPDANLSLASMFAQAETVAPSRGMSSEWNALRSRYQQTIRSAAPMVREALRDARREGSFTLGRNDLAAIAKYDQGAALVDHMVRGQIGLGANAMNAVHAVVASKDNGQLRGAGQDVARGGNTERMYLPGDQVAAAVGALFTNTRQNMANGLETPHVAAVFNQRLISIHPYTDANGRTTRLMTDWVLARGGFPPVIASTRTESTSLFWQSREVQRGVHLERLTQGMRRTVEILERAVG